MTTLLAALLLQPHWSRITLIPDVLTVSVLLNWHPVRKGLPLVAGMADWSGDL